MHLGQAYAAGAGTGVQCVDPDTGDLVICPPGTQCDPQGSGQCVGTVVSGAPTCPVGQNLTAIGQSCQCPAGYEYDANQNQCVPGVVSVFALSPGSTAQDAANLATSAVTATTSTTNILIGLALAGLVAYFIFEKG